MNFTLHDLPLEATGLQRTLHVIAQQKLREMQQQREEILAAFIAKYGYEPDRIIQVEQFHHDGTKKWFVRRMTDEEYEKLALNSSQL